MRWLTTWIRYCTHLYKTILVVSPPNISHQPRSVPPTQRIVPAPEEFWTKLGCLDWLIYEAFLLLFCERCCLHMLHRPRHVPAEEVIWRQQRSVGDFHGRDLGGWTTFNCIYFTLGGKDINLAGLLILWCSSFRVGGRSQPVVVSKKSTIIPEETRQGLGQWAEITGKNRQMLGSKESKLHFQKTCQSCLTPLNPERSYVIDKLSVIRCKTVALEHIPRMDSSFLTKNS